MKEKAVAKTKKRKSGLTFWEKVYRSRVLLLMCLPAVIFFFALQVKSSEKASLLLAQSLI